MIMVVQQIFKQNSVFTFINSIFAFNYVVIFNESIVVAYYGLRASVN
jgi:hypothetical protein